MSPFPSKARPVLRLAGHATERRGVPCGADWTWLLRLCDPAVRDDWDKRDNAGIVFTAQQRAARSAMDRFTTAVINEHSRRRPAAPVSFKSWRGWR
jgi:hypothetical protein